MTAVVDMSGRRIGSLLVLSRVPGKQPRGHAHWLCACDCGAKVEVIGHDLRSGHVRSCGCFRKGVLASSGYKHGGALSPEWRVWSDMVRRCTDPRVAAFVNYGGRGISVCNRWLSFENFRDDMGERKPGMTLERKDVNGNYEPGNCEWIPAALQARNTRRTVRVSLDGGETVCLKVACERLGVSYSRTLDRINKLGWTFERAIREPKKVNGGLYAAREFA